MLNVHNNFMSKTPRATPTKTAKQKECEDVEQELCTRALSLLASFYETPPSTTEISTFPPAKKIDLPEIDRKISFHSNVADLRLKRSVDQQAKENQSLQQNVASRIENMAETLKDNDVDLDDVFMPEKAERPELPKYLQNLQRDEEIMQGLMKKPLHIPMDMLKVQREYTRRLEIARKKGIERAKNRIQRQQKGEAGSPSLSTYKSSFSDRYYYDPGSTERAKMNLIRARRAAQVGYKTPEEYRSFARNKPPVTKASE